MARNARACQHVRERLLLATARRRRWPYGFDHLAVANAREHTGDRICERGRRSARHLAARNHDPIFACQGTSSLLHTTIA
jgi:hypothetical protein